MYLSVDKYNDIIVFKIDEILDMKYETYDLIKYKCGSVINGSVKTMNLLVRRAIWIGT